MFWADEIAERIIAKNPSKEEYVCAAGISPSGSVHIGNFRDVATSFFVAKALKRAGKNVSLLFSWDELDRLRKIPKNVQEIAEGFEKYIGNSYVDVPNPFKNSSAKTYAEYFEKEFESAIKDFKIDMRSVYQAKMYRSGKYAPYIIEALGKRKEIFDILDKHRTQDAVEGERDNYYPVSIYCPVCGKDNTKITALSDDCKTAEYECKCTHKGKFDFTKDYNCKLAWKVDWPMRWKFEGVDFEPGGKDHASEHGSYTTSKEISKKIFGYEPPVFQGYEFIGIKGATGKMSGSSGLNLTPQTLLKLYEPEVLLWLYAKTSPDKAFDFCFDDGILRQYFEFDKMLTEYRAGGANEFVNSVMHYCQIEGREIKTVPMSLLVQLGSIVNFNPEMLEVVFKKIGTPYTREDFKERLNRAKFWLEECSPQSVNRLLAQKDEAYFASMSGDEKAEIKELYNYLAAGNYDLDALGAELYAIPWRTRGMDKDDKSIRAFQSKFFKNVYNLLIGKDQGPRLYLFLYAVEKDSYINLLNF